MSIDGGGGRHRSIWYERGADEVWIIDQTRLPHEFECRRLKSLADACEAISAMRVRGAPLIGVTAAFGVYLALRDDPASLDASIGRLRATRPTAVNLRWALDRTARALANQPVADIAGKALASALALAEQDVACCQAIGELGAEVLRRAWAALDDPVRPLRVLTHCNTGALAAVDWGTALAVIHKAAADGVPVHVWVDETRPRNQGGALTCWELRRAGIPHSLIVDSAAGHVMARGLVDICLVGADRVSARGDVCNKIGTYPVALAAKDNNLPFYAALPVSSIDYNWSGSAPAPAIEERDADEISVVAGIDADGRETALRLYPEATGARNFAFDITPARLVGGIITERGVFAAERNALAALAETAD